jgi:hypothetical protein
MHLVMSSQARELRLLAAVLRLLLYLLMRRANAARSIHINSSDSCKHSYNIFCFTACDCVSRVLLTRTR